MFCLVRVAPLEMDANSRPSDSAASEPAFVELAEVDIPGDPLDEPLVVCNVAALGWWVQFMESDQACTLAEKATVDFKVNWVCFFL